MAFQLHFVYMVLLLKLVSTFVTKVSQLYLEVSHKVSRMCHILSQMLITRSIMEIQV